MSVYFIIWCLKLFSRWFFYLRTGCWQLQEDENTLSLVCNANDRSICECLLCFWYKDKFAWGRLRLTDFKCPCKWQNKETKRCGPCFVLTSNRIFTIDKLMTAIVSVQQHTHTQNDLRNRRTECDDSERTSQLVSKPFRFAQSDSVVGRLLKVRWHLFERQSNAIRLSW